MLEIQPRIITIDGLAGSGKSTVAHKLAKKLGFVHLNSGLLFRALAWAGLKRGLNLSDEAAFGELVSRLSFEFKIDSEGETIFAATGNPTLAELNSASVSEAASRIATYPRVRDVLAQVQRLVAASKSIVVEGRDAGTVIFPDARLKFYLDADLAERARRRYQQLIDQGFLKGVSLEEVQSSLKERDERDASRAYAPHRQAADAVLIKTDALSVEQVVEELYRRS